MSNRLKDAKYVNQSLGTSPRFGPFSGQQFVVISAVFSLVFLLTRIILGIDLFYSIAASLWASLTLALLSGDRPHLFWSKLYPGIPYWVRGYVKYSAFHFKEKVGNKAVKVPLTKKTKSKRLNPFEDYLDLLSLVKIQTPKYLTGAYLLSKKSLISDNSKFQLKFGYSCVGFHPTFNSSEEVKAFTEAFEAGCKDIPLGENLTFQWSSFCDYSERKEYLKKRLSSPVTPESEFLDYAQYAKTQQLNDEEKRKIIKLNVYATLTISPETQEPGDFLDKVLTKLAILIKKFFTKSGNKEITYSRLVKIFKKATEASMRYEQTLSRMGLSPQPKTEKELWIELSQEIGAKIVEIPHILVFDGENIIEEFPARKRQGGRGQGAGGSRQGAVRQGGRGQGAGGASQANDKVGSQKFRQNLGVSVSNPPAPCPLPPASSHLLPASSPFPPSDLHLTSVLLNNEVPFADKRWVCLSDSKNSKNKRYVGVMVLERKPEIFASDSEQIRFLWNVFSKDGISNVKIVTQVSPADRNVARTSQQMITKRSRTLDLNVQQRKSLDVAARIQTERSVEAQERLYTGDVPLNVSLVVLVYRKSPEEVDDACRLIAGYINQPAELSRENEYAWLIWLQTLNLQIESTLVSPYNRRLSFFSSEVLGLVSAVQVSKADSKGFELIADEGHEPVLIDMSKPKNMMILGTTGSGKSVLAASLIAECLAMGMSVLILDLPNEDGTGTFGDLTPYFGGAYFDISKESNNIVQPLDLSKVPLLEAADRVKAHRNDVISIISQLVLGSQSFDGLLAQTIESVIPLGIAAFYEDQQIQQRFEAARIGGLGSEAWANTPTVIDMERFFSIEHINLGYEDSTLDAALNYIRLRFQYWRSSAIGDAICKPSTFDPEAKLVTFALTNLQSGKEAEVFGMSAYIAASRQTLSSPNSVFFMDEASVLLRFTALAALIGRLCAIARKAGMRVFLAAQDVISIAQSFAGSQILQNMPLRLIGRIVPGAAQSFEEILGIPKEIIKKNETFRPNIKELFTLWLLDYNNKYTLCRYYPSNALLALVANSREEQACRDRFKQRYPDKFEWLSEFYKYYVKCIKENIPI